MYRRTLIQNAMVLSAGAAISRVGKLPAAFGIESPSSRKFTMDLCPGRLGVQTDQWKTIELAQKYGFESVEPFGDALAKMNADEIAKIQSTLNAAKLKWGAGGLSVEFRKTNELFLEGMKALPAIAAAFQKAGVTRVGTWISPSHDSLTYTQNLKQHAKRLGEICAVFQDHGLKLGLEYVGPKTLWSSSRYPFVHTLAETKDLIAAINAKNVGIVLDSWHWYTADETVADITTLKNGEIVAVDLNDAPEGIAKDQQIDSKRTLPMDTGVINLKEFLDTLIKIGYDGPIRAEPFNKELNALDDEPAVEKTATAMKKAFQLVS